MHALEQAQHKPVSSLRRSSTATSIASSTTASAKEKEGINQQRIPSWYRVGWTAFSSKPNPGGILPILATEKTTIQADSLEEEEEKGGKQVEEGLFEKLYYMEWLRQTGSIVLIGTFSWVLATYGGGTVTFIVLCFFLITYNHMATKRFTLHVRDDIKRDLVSLQFEQEPEPAEWLNSFLKNFWLIFEPVLSAYVIENIDTYLVDYLPGFLDSVRLTTFTLGNKPFRIENVKTLSSEDNVVCMDWLVTFEPSDTIGMTKKELQERKSPRVELSIRLGKGFVGAAIPVLVEHMSFSGHLRVKLEFISRYPYIRLVEACFMKNPEFDYVLKPIGGDAFGFDVNNLPGLQSFVRDQVHAILGPMMYYPNVFSFDIEKFFSGELDISQANGVLAITTYGTSTINSSDIPGGDPNLLIRFYLDKAQELGRTGTRQGTLEPIWNETHFLMLNNLQSKLTLEMRNDSGSSFKDQRVGRAHYDLSELAEDEDFAIEGLDVDLLRKGKRITTLKVDMRYLPVSKPTTLEDGTIEPAVESNSGVLRFTIHECRNLKSNRISPYAKVMVNGVEKVKTPAFKRTSNPKFERSGEVVVLDRTAIFLRVDIYDSIDFAEDSILGTWSSYLLPVMEQQSKNNGWWDLTIGNKNVGRIRVSVQWKPIVMSGLIHGSIGPNVYRSPIGIIRFSLWEARDLKNVETVGKSDPYVRIMSGSQVRARTQVIDNHLFPEWGEFHYVPVHSMHEDLVLEVMDWNAKSKDKLLGSTKLRIKHLVKQISGKDKDDSIKWYEQLEKIDKWVPLQSPSKKGTKGELRYTAEFYPTLALKEDQNINKNDENDNIQSEKDISESNLVNYDTNNNEPLDIENDKSAVEPNTTENLLTANNNSDISQYMDLHGLPIKRTPDGLVDLKAYNSGIIKIHIHEVQLSKQVHAYCAVMVDSLYSQFKTSSMKGKTLLFNEASDAFVKEADFSRINIDIRPADSDEKDDEKYGYWAYSAIDIIRSLQQKKRLNKEEEKKKQQTKDNNSNTMNNNDDDDHNGAEDKVDQEEDDEDQGEWYNLFGTEDGPGRIRLSFDYIPLLNFTLNPDESLENQGSLTVTLLDAKDLMAADKSGTSDPYVVFIVNGEPVYKSPVVKKTLNPIWKDVQFTQQIISRVTASFRIDVFDWNQFQGDTALGCGGISLRNEYVESFTARDVRIPIDGVKGAKGYVRVRFLWQPQLLTTRKTSTSLLTTMRTMTYHSKSSTSGTTAFDFGKPLPSSATSSPLRASSLPRTPPVPAKTISKDMSTTTTNENNNNNNQEQEQSFANQQLQLQKEQEQSTPTLRSQQINQQNLNHTNITKNFTSDTLPRGKITVNIESARNLMAADKNGLSDPFVHVRLNHHTLYKTRAIKKTLDPEWNESFQFELTNPKESVLEYIVKDYNRFSHSVELGTYQQDHNTFKELVAAKRLNQKIPLQPQGEMIIRMEFSPHH
ncbi:unnamed protein product [Cunninghamella echinulata]